MQPSLVFHQSLIRDSIIEARRKLEENHSLAKQNKQLRDAFIKEMSGGRQWHYAADVFEMQEDLCMGMLRSSSPKDLADSQEQACPMSEHGESPFRASIHQSATRMDKQGDDSLLLGQSDDNNISSPAKTALSVKIQKTAPAKPAPEREPFLSVYPAEGAQGKCRQTMSSCSADVTDSAHAALPQRSEADKNQHAPSCVLSTASSAGQIPNIIRDNHISHLLTQKHEYGQQSETAARVEWQLGHMIGSEEIAVSTSDLEEQISNKQPPPKTNSLPVRILPAGVTTIVVRNVPARFSREQLLQFWPPDGTYDLIYLPYSMKKQRKAGLVFINMISHEEALGFTAKWHGRKISNVVGAKPLHVGVADVQGLIGNLKHFKGSNVARMNKEEFLPAAFKGTQKLDLKSLLAGLEIPARAG